MLGVHDEIVRFGAAYRYYEAIGPPSCSCTNSLRCLNASCFATACVTLESLGTQACRGTNWVTQETPSGGPDNHAAVPGCFTQRFVVSEMFRPNNSDWGSNDKYSVQLFLFTSSLVFSRSHNSFPLPAFPWNILRTRLYLNSKLSVSGLRTACESFFAWS